MKLAYLRRAAVGIGLVALIGAAAPYLPLDFLKPQIERALARGIGRRVDVAGVSLTLFSGPGFSLSGVTLAEDPRAGIEPFLYAGSVEARVDLAGLLRGRRGFASLRMSDATVNLVKTAAGPWNFQMLLAGPLGPYPGPRQPGAWQMPAIRMRGGRVNLKYGESKSVVYFDDADLDVARNEDASLDLRFSGVPARTDQAAESFSHFFLRGTARPSPGGPQLALTVDMEPAALDGLARLLHRPGLNAPAGVTVSAQLTGTPAHLAVSGTLSVDETRSSGFLAQRSGHWQMAYRGSLDAVGQTLEVVGEPAPPDDTLRVILCGSDLFEAPQISAIASFRNAPVAVFFDAARTLGAPLPEQMTAAGEVSGALEYSMAAGLAGNLQIENASLALPGNRPLKAESARIAVSPEAITMSPTLVATGEDDAPLQSARVEASYSLGASSGSPVAGLALTMTTQGLPVAGLRSLGMKDLPLLDRISQGTVAGSLRYRMGQWSCDCDLREALVSIDGLAAPVKIASASVITDADRVAVTRMAASAGDVKFRGEYRWEPKAPHPHQFQLQVEEATPSEIERLFQPVLIRGGGLLARTFRMGAAVPVPAWLAGRQAEGTVSIRQVPAGDHLLSVASSRVVWEGTDLRFSAIDARLDDAPVRGQAAVDLSGAAPRYWLQGKLAEVPYSGGAIDFTGRIEAAGAGPGVLNGLRAEGSFKGRSIAFSPDAEFRTAAGRFTLAVADGSPRWKFSALEVTQGPDTYSGQGGTQQDGKLVLDLTSRGRQVRYTGSLVALGPQP